jgi:hypothetical protein
LVRSQVAEAPRSAVIVSSTSLTLPPCGVSTTSMADFEPGWDALGRFAKESFRTGTVGAVLVPEVGLLEYVGFAVVGFADGVFDDADGDGVVVSARAGAVPLTRTMPVPTPMISGLRTDRASTAYNLPNNRH